MMKTVAGKIVLKLLLSTAILLVATGLFHGRAYASYDKTAPVVNSITMDKTEITKPGVVRLTFDITEEETGLNRIDVAFMTTENVDLNTVFASVTCNEDAYSIKPAKYTGKFTLSYNISSKYPTNDLQVGQVDVYDNAGNHRLYWNGWEYGKDEKGTFLNDFYNEVNKCYIINDTVAVKDEYDVDFQYHVTNPNIAARLSAMDEGKTGMVMFDKNYHIAKKEWFNAIRGKNKNLVFANESIQWFFNGKSITTITKNIDLQTSIQDDIGQRYGINTNVLRIVFPNNGLLPGTATIRIKSDFVYEQFRLGKTLHLYYIDGDRASRETTAIKNLIDGTDHWCEFSINHNSSFLISSQQVKLITRTKIIKARKLKRGFYIKWKRIKKGINGYQIQYSTRSDFRSKTKSVTIKNPKSVSKKIRKLKAKKKYFVRIRTYQKIGKKKYYSEWSKAKMIKTK